MASNASHDERDNKLNTYSGAEELHAIIILQLCYAPESEQFLNPVGDLTGVQMETLRR